MSWKTYSFSLNSRGGHKFSESCGAECQEVIVGGVLAEARVEADDGLDLVEAGNIKGELLGSDQEYETLRAGWGGKRPGVFVKALLRKDLDEWLKS